MQSFNGIGIGHDGMGSTALSGQVQVQVQVEESMKNHTITPSSHNSLIQMKMGNASNQLSTQSPPLLPSDHEIDTKRLKRILASRQYSQKYRYKQLQNTLELQRQLKSLEAHIKAVHPKIKQADHSVLMLGLENTSIKLRISTYTDVLLSKEAECEKLRMERDMLKQLHQAYHPRQQQQEDRLLPTPMESNSTTHHVNSSFKFSDIYHNIRNIHITTNNNSNTTSSSTGSTVPNNFTYFDNFTVTSHNNANTNINNN